MKALITGGTGFIGAELARTLVGKGEDVTLFDIAPNYTRISDIRDNINVVQGNLVYGAEVFNVVKDNNIESIYHLAAMMGVPSNANPWASFQINVVGTMNVLEAARLFGVNKVVLISTISTYGLNRPSVVTDDTIQRPTSMYGCCKLYCELLGRFYRSRFGLDFRAVRFPAIIGPGVVTPGPPQYIARLIEYPALGKPYECCLSEDTKCAVIYFKDAVRAVDMVSQAPKDRIKTINYNIAGVTPTPTAKEIELTVKKYIPESQISYKPDSEVVDYYRSTHIDVFDDSRARKEWDWQPAYSDFDRIVPDIINELQLHPELYEVA